MAKLYVQKGKSITSKRGILAEGEEVVKEDFVAEEKAITGLIERGALGTTNPTKPVEKATEKIVEKDKKESGKIGGGADKK